MSLPEKKDHFVNVKKGIRNYIEQRLNELSTKPNPDFSIEETDEFPIIHDEVSSVQFYRLLLKPASDDHIGMRLNHKPRVEPAADDYYKITTDLDFTEPQSPGDGTYTRIRKPGDEFVADVEQGRGSYEIVFSVLKALHVQYSEQFPDPSGIFAPN